MILDNPFPTSSVAHCGNKYTCTSYKEGLFLSECQTWGCFSVAIFEHTIVSDPTKIKCQKDIVEINFEYLLDICKR